MSGVVEETPGRLEYEVALYKEAPAARITNSSNELPVDQVILSFNNVIKLSGCIMNMHANITGRSNWNETTVTGENQPRFCVEVCEADGSYSFPRSR